MQKGHQNDVVVMDFAKAFDKVAHNRLLYKLSSYGVKINSILAQFVANHLYGKAV